MTAQRVKAAKKETPLTEQIIKDFTALLTSLCAAESARQGLSPEKDAFPKEVSAKEMVKELVAGASAADVKKLRDHIKALEAVREAMRGTLQGAIDSVIPDAERRECAARVLDSIMSAFLQEADKELAKWQTADRKRKEKEKREAMKKAFIEANPYTGVFGEQYANPKTRELYAPIPQSPAIMELLSNPLTPRNSEITKDGDTLVHANRGYSFLILAKGRVDEKTGELIDVTQNRLFSAIMTLTQILIEIPRQKDAIDEKYPKVYLSLVKSMALRDLKDEQNARIQMARDLQILQSTTIPFTDEQGLGRAYQLLQERNVPKRGDKITAVLSAAFYKELMDWYKNMMPYPLELLKLNPEYDGITHICGLQLVFNQFYFYGEKRGENGVKASKIAMYAEPLLPSVEDLRTGGRHYKQQRVDPFFTAVKRLGKTLGKTAEGIGLYRLADSKKAAAGDNFNAVCLTCNEWKNYPDISAERRESRTARDNAKKNKTGKK